MTKSYPLSPICSAVITPTLVPASDRAARQAGAANGDFTGPTLPQPGDGSAKGTITAKAKAVFLDLFFRPGEIHCVFLFSFIAQADRPACTSGMTAVFFNAEQCRFGERYPVPTGCSRPGTNDVMAGLLTCSSPQTAAFPGLDTSGLHGGSPLNLLCCGSSAGFPPTSFLSWRTLAHRNHWRKAHQMRNLKWSINRRLSAKSKDKALDVGACAG